MSQNLIRGISKAELTRVGMRLVEDVTKDGEVNTTLLAENIAHDLDRDEILDDLEGLIWDVAYEITVSVEENYANQ